MLRQILRQCTRLGLLLLGVGNAADRLVEWSTATARFELGVDGAFRSLVLVGAHQNYLAPQQPSPLLSVRLAGKWYTPDQATWDAVRREITLHFRTAHATASLRAIAQPSHLAFEVVEVQPAESVELVLWGPYSTTVRGIIGEIVGVVRDGDVAIGIQALNPKTLGGYPVNENDIDHEYGADDTGIYRPPFTAELQHGQSFRGDTAQGTAFGSILQAYTRNRTAGRVLPNWGHEKYRILPMPDGGLVGSRIALFAVPEAHALATIGSIEVAEGLPHPLIDGVWAKQSPAATASYLIVDFGEATIDRAIEMTRRAGLKYLYHSSPFATWGHFQLKTNLFPNGWAGFRRCADQARNAGIRLGFHTLSNFITPNDGYVTPQPDPRLAVIGSSEIASEIDATTTEIPVSESEYFQKKSVPNAVRLQSELVRFEGVSTEPPWHLLHCERGAWGTKPAHHPRGTPVDRLLDHDYKVFLTDASLAQEVAHQIARFCNETGAQQLSFDGLEGNWSTGYGQYGRTLFTQAWYQTLAPSLRGQIINDASNPGHFNWHINTRMNWGEPWYAGFRESQTLYRFKNQVLFERNLMPHMLGWFALRPDTCLEDAEWLLARAAGFDAGFTLATSLASTAQLAADPASADTARRFGATAAILATIAEWETARMSGAFPAELKLRLRDNLREFHLQPVQKLEWDLREVAVTRHPYLVGTSDTAAFFLTNHFAAQPLQLIVRSQSTTPIGELTIELNGATVLVQPGGSLPAMGSLRLTGDSEVVLADNTWKELARRKLSPQQTSLPVGTSVLRIRAALPEGDKLQLEFRVMGPATRIRSQRPVPSAP